MAAHAADARVAVATVVRAVMATAQWAVRLEQVAVAEAMEVCSAYRMMHAHAAAWPGNFFRQPENLTETLWIEVGRFRNRNVRFGL